MMSILNYTIHFIIGLNGTDGEKGSIGDKGERGVQGQKGDSKAGYLLNIDENGTLYYESLWYYVINIACNPF